MDNRDRVFLSTAFSPMMMGEKGMAVEIVECSLDEIPAHAYSVVGHEVTAQIMTALLGRQVSFNRESITLLRGDVLFCVIPGFRATEAREFSREEVTDAGFRAFKALAY